MSTKFEKVKAMPIANFKNPKKAAIVKNEKKLNNL